MFASLSAPIDTIPRSLGSFASNQLDYDGNGTYTAEGITKLCEALKGSTVTSLKCATAEAYSLLWQRPLTRACALSLPPPIARSLENNDIGAEGASVLAAVLKETMITHLQCAAAPKCSLSCTVSAH